MQNEIVPAKILLFGEYTLLTGSRAICVPYWKLNGKWSYEKGNDPKIAHSRFHLEKFFNEALLDGIDKENFRIELDKGLWFDSTIPQGYGVGSSGAVIAAIYRRFSFDKGDALDQRSQLAKLENYFHGSSSGLDPLVSLVKKPLLIYDTINVQVLNEDLNLENFFLLDTGTSRQSSTFVKIYQSKIQEGDFRRKCVDILCADVNFAINALIKNDLKDLYRHMISISKFQFENFPEMIPDEVYNTWMNGIRTGDYALKLCGAGGGGFILGMQNPSSVENVSDLDGFPLTYV